MYLYYKAQ